MLTCQKIVCYFKALTQEIGRLGRRSDRGDGVEWRTALTAAATSVVLPTQTPSSPVPRCRLQWLGLEISVMLPGS